MKKIRPKTALIVGYVILAVATVICFLNAQSKAFMLVQIITAFVAIIAFITIRLWLCRCPHCGKPLSSFALLMGNDHCPHCGKDIN